MCICKASSLPVQCLPVALVVQASSESLLGKHCVCIQCHIVLCLKIMPQLQKKGTVIPLQNGVSAAAALPFSWPCMDMGQYLSMYLALPHWAGVVVCSVQFCCACATRLLLVKVLYLSRLHVGGNFLVKVLYLSRLHVGVGGIG